MNNSGFLLPPKNFLEALRYCRDPRLVAFHFSHINRLFALAMRVTGCSRQDIDHVLQEILMDEIFLQDVTRRLKSVTGRAVRGSDYMFLTRIESKFPFRVVSEEAGSMYFHGIIYYVLVRLMRPVQVVETGGTPGFSSAFILRAMERNQAGMLHTVDLPPSGDFPQELLDNTMLHKALPESQQSGWIIPSSLHSRHRQHLGDARQLLPELLKTLDEIDVFIHDSDHSYEHMVWEFATAWPHIRTNGLLISDDIGTNAAFDEFVLQVGKPSSRPGALGVIHKV